MLLIKSHSSNWLLNIFVVDKYVIDMNQFELHEEQEKKWILMREHAIRHIKYKNL